MPLQKVAMGLLIVFLSVSLVGYDALPDPLGWALVLAGVLALRHRLDNAQTLLALAAAATVVATILYWPAVHEALAPSGAWVLSLPQIGFCIALCRSVAVAAAEPEARKVRTLGRVFVVLAVAPVLLYGGGMAVLEVPIAVAISLADVYLIYLLFRLSRAEFALA